MAKGSFRRIPRPGDAALERHGLAPACSGGGNPAGEDEMTRQRRRKAPAVFLVIGAAMAFAAGAWAESVEDLRRIVDSRICPPDTSTYTSISYAQHCGENYLTNMTTREISRCQDETDKLNSVIFKYNDFMWKCRG
jgi:hypothetical protein